jgi:hypothetical protein
MALAPDPADLVGFVPAPDPADIVAGSELAPDPADLVQASVVEPEPPTFEELEARRKAAEAEESRKTFIERYGPPTAAFLQGLSSGALPFVAGKVEELAGLPREEQLKLREEHPVASGLGTVGGIVGGVLATGGIGAAAEAAGANAAAAAAATGASRAAQVAAAAKAAATVGSRAGVAGSAISPLAIAARVGAGAKAATTAALPVLGKTAAGRVAASTAGALAEGALISTALEADEARLEGREMHADAILHGALVSGGIGGVLTGVPAAVGAFGQTEMGRRLAQSAGASSAKRLLEKFGTTTREKARAIRWVGQDRFVERLRDAFRFGIASPRMSVEKTLERAGDMLEASGKTIGQFASEADARIAASPDLAPRVDDVMEALSDDVLAPLTRDPHATATAQQISNLFQQYREGFEGGVTLEKLKTLRQQVSEKIDNIYRSGGTRDVELADALRDVRDVLTKQITSGLERTGLDPAAWRIPQRQYEVASQIRDLAMNAQNRAISQAPQTLYERATGYLVPGAASAYGYLSGGLVPAAIYAAGTKIAGAALGKIMDWAPGAIQRALESGAPKTMIEDMGEFASRRGQQILEAGKGSGAADKLAEARTRFLNVYRSLDAAQQEIASNPNMSGKSFDAYKMALNNARSAMQSEYAKAMTPETIADVIEEIDTTLTPLSVLGPGREWMHQPAVAAVRAVRDEARATLALHDLWSAQRQKAALERLNNAARVMVDEDRVAALGALEEMTRSLQSRAQTKADKLMGLAGRTAEKAAQTRDRDIKRGARKIYEVIGGRTVARPAEEVERQMEQERRDAAAAAAEAP